MAYISVTNALNDNSATSDITLVGANFTDVVNGLSDGTKDLNVAKVTAATGFAGTIIDSNGNEIIKSTTTASAVNELTIANAATGGSPTISATGGDTNIGITLTPKGTGVTTLGAIGGRVYCGYKTHTSGTTTLFTAADSSCYLVSWTGLSTGEGDDRWLCAIAQCMGNALCTKVVDLSTGATLGGEAVPSISWSGQDLQFSGGSGTPNGTIYWTRLA